MIIMADKGTGHGRFAEKFRVGKAPQIQNSLKPTAELAVEFEIGALVKRKKNGERVNQQEMQKSTTFSKGDLMMHRTEYK